MDPARHTRLLAWAIIGCFIPALAMAQPNTEGAPGTQSELLRSCQGCHGADGNSEITSTPRLNGQQSGYIVDRLKKYSDLTRTNPHAKVGMFKELSEKNDAARMSIARYFAGQPPTSPRPGARAEEGKRIYEKGGVEDNVVACALCHGPKGEGHDTTPRIAGQHADYLKAQLRMFNVKFREHILMNHNAKTMSDGTMDALVAYLAND